MQGKHQVNGSWGQLWWNNELLVELSSFEAKLNINREDVIVGMSVDSKMVSMAGEGTFTIKKVYSRNKKQYLEAWKKGEDIRTTLVGKIADPDTPGKQSERVSISNVWLNELMLMQFEQANLATEEYSFGFTPQDASFLDVIK